MINKKNKDLIVSIIILKTLYTTVITTTELTHTFIITICKYWLYLNVLNLLINLSYKSFDRILPNSLCVASCYHEHQHEYENRDLQKANYHQI